MILVQSAWFLHIVYCNNVHPFYLSLFIKNTGSQTRTIFTVTGSKQKHRYCVSHFNNKRSKLLKLIRMYDSLYKKEPLSYVYGYHPLYFFERGLMVSLKYAVSFFLESAGVKRTNFKHYIQVYYMTILALPWSQDPCSGVIKFTILVDSPMVFLNILSVPSQYNQKEKNEKKRKNLNIILYIYLNTVYDHFGPTLESKPLP